MQITGVTMLILAGFLEWESLRLRYYTSLGPGPGFFGVWLAGVAAVCAVGVIITATRGPNLPLPEEFWPTKPGLFRMAVVIGGLAWMAGFMELLGYRITSFVFLTALIYVMGMRNLWLVLGSALLGSFGVYWLFVDFLYTPMPVGVLGL